MRSMKTWLWIIAITWAIVGCSKTPNIDVHDVESARRSFERANGAQSRRNVAIAILDSGLIGKWRSVSEVDRIFGTDFYAKRKEIVPGRKYTAGVIFLEEQPDIADEDVAVEPVGWYLVFEFGPDGTLHNYYLTNASK
jgi:hypothetical protein